MSQSKPQIIQIDGRLPVEEFRQWAFLNIKPDSNLIVNLGDLGFTQIRAYLSVVNTLAWTRHCLLKYKNQSSFVSPPLPARYQIPPSITPYKHP